jgi:hypothetical protein
LYQPSSKKVLNRHKVAKHYDLAITIRDSSWPTLVTLGEPTPAASDMMRVYKSLSRVERAAKEQASRIMHRDASLIGEAVLA